MKKTILLAIITLAAFVSNSQCAASFTWSINGNTVQFTNTSTGTSSYYWTFGDGASSSTANPTHTYSTYGTYDICLSAYFQDSMGGFCVDTLCHQVTVLDSTGGGGSSCDADFTWTVSGNTVFFNNTSTGTNANYWSFGDGGNSSATNPTYTYSSPGTYWVCLDSYYSDSLQTSCSDSTCYQITVLDSTGGGGSPCDADFTWTVSGNTVFFNNTSNGTNMNNWSFGDGGGSSATNPTYTYPSAGTYWVCLYSYYSDSLQTTCADSVCYPITVVDSIGGGSSCDADFTWTVSGNTVFFNNTSNGTNMNNWSFGDGGGSSATNPTYTYPSAGTYWVCLYSYYSDSLQTTCADSVCYPITVVDSMGGGSSCDADFTWTVSGNTVSFNNTSTGTNANYWSFGDGGNSSATNPTYTYSSPGTYWVCLDSYYSDSLQTSCSDSVCYQINVFDSLDSTATATALSFNEFHLYPNPTSSVLNIQFDQLPGNSHALIVDMLGREMVEVDLTSLVTEVRVADFPKGVYLVQLFDSNDRIIGMSRFVRE